MNKTSQILAQIQAGARSNKYRIIFPYFTEEIDILCNSTTSPGREVGIAEVYLKGRKFSMAGEVQDDSAWEFTIYNTPDLLVRRFFLKILGGIHNFQTPETIDTVYNQRDFSQTFGTLDNSNLGTVGGIIDSGLLQAVGLGKVGNTISQINNGYKQMKSNWNTIKSIPNTLKNAVENGFNLISRTSGTGGNYNSGVWYMSEVIIQQLDHNDKVQTETMLHNAFVSKVSALEYTDDVGDVSQTTISFTYTGIEFGNTQEIRTLEKY